MKIRKSIFVIMILFISIYSASALMEQESKGFDLQGGYSDFFSLSVKLIDAPSVGYTAGMPFNILSSSADPNQTENGILIANWSMLTNQKNFTFSIVCNSLKPVDLEAAKDPKNEIAYILTFIYRLSIYEQGHSSKMNTTKFMVASDGSINDPTPRNPINNTTVFDSQSLMGTNAGEIYLKLTPDNYVKDGTTKNSKLDNAVEGDYQGLVTITMEMVQ